MSAVLFDFGGTIDTDGVHWSEKYWELYERFRSGVAKPAFEHAFVESERLLNADPTVARLTFRETLEKQLSLQFAILGVANDLRDRMARDCYADVTATIGRARQVLERLRTRHRLGVVSNFYGNLGVVCSEFGLDTLFDVQIDSAVAGVRKPDPAIFALALERLRARPRDAWVVGDSYERDIVPGKHLGCRTIWLRGRSWAEPPETGAADYTIGAFSELEGILS
jgi:putative hydrolase of the HAD superfamily